MRNQDFMPSKQTLLACSISVFVVVLAAKIHPVVGLGFALLPFAMVLAVRVSSLFIILFILFSYFRLHEAFPVLMPLKIPKMLALAALLGIAWHLFISKTLQPIWHSGHIAFALFFTWLVIASLCASNRGMSIAYLNGNLSKLFIMVFAISWWLRSLKELGWVRMGIAASGSAVALVAISNKIQGIGLVEGTRVSISRHLGSQLGDPNDLSLVMMFPVSFLAAEVFVSQYSITRRLFMLALLILAFSAVIATQSRGGLLGISAVFGYFLYRRLQSPVLTGVVGGIGLLILAVLAGIGDRASGGAAEEGIDASAMGRLWAWQAAINMALANPMTGVGLDNFYVNYFFYSPHWDGKNHAVHSTWFQVLAETGFVGLILFAVLITTIFRTLRAISRRPISEQNPDIALNLHALRSGLAGFLVAGTFLTQAFTWPLYIILALTIALDRISLLHSEKTNKKNTANNLSKPNINSDKKSNIKPANKLKNMLNNEPKQHSGVRKKPYSLSQSSKLPNADKNTRGGSS